MVETQELLQPIKCQTNSKKSLLLKANSRKFN
jgi:hypothetical protein